MQFLAIHVANCDGHALQVETGSCAHLVRVNLAIGRRQDCIGHNDGRHDLDVALGMLLKRSGTQPTHGLVTANNSSKKCSDAITNTITNPSASHLFSCRLWFGVVVGAHCIVHVDNRCWLW